MSLLGDVIQDKRPLTLGKLLTLTLIQVNHSF